MPRVADSREVIFKAAAAEFAANGFAGTTVDRIAARSRLNKAMIYYHFESKDALYDEILREIFAGLGDWIARVAASDDEPGAKLARAIDAIAATAVSHPHFPPMMAREMAEAGVHLDRTTIATMLRVFTGVAGILQEGQRRGAFRPIDPLHTYFAIIAPLVFFLASKPVRERLTRQLRGEAGSIDLPTLAGPDDFGAMVAEHQRAIAMIVARTGAVRPRRARASAGPRRPDSRHRSNQRGPR